MRLEIFDTQATVAARVIAQLVRFVNGFSPDIVKMFLYRKEYFGDHFQPMLHEVMRAGDEWTAGERELMAAFVSSKNQCRYCTDAHRATAAAFEGHALANAVVKFGPNAPVSPKLRAILEFLDKLTVAPRDVGPADIQALREAGLSNEAIENAAEICAHFCVLNRLADTFGFRIQTPKQIENHAKNLSEKHYKF